MRKLIKRLYLIIMPTIAMPIITTFFVLWYYYAAILSKNPDKTLDRLLDFGFKVGRAEFLLRIKRFVFRHKTTGITREEIEKLSWKFKDYANDKQTEVFTKTDLRENKWELYHKGMFICIAMMKEKEGKEVPAVAFNGFPKNTYDLLRIMRLIGIALKMKND